MSTNRPKLVHDVFPKNVTVLPTGADRYEGRVVDYWPTGTIGQGPIWRLVWRSAANGGAGAWMGVSATPYGAYTDSVQTTGSSSFVALAGGPSLTLAYNGTYHVTHSDQMSNDAGNTGEVKSLVYAGGEKFASLVATTKVIAGAIYSMGSSSILVLDAGTVQTRYATAAGTLSRQRGSLTVSPIEIRP